MAPTRDWQSLAKKLERGETLERASINVGIPIEEARDWARKRIADGETDVVTQLLTAQTALKTGFEILEKIARGGARSKDLGTTDLEAAKALVQAALAIQRLSNGGGSLRVGGKVSSGQRDLFDQEEVSNWNELKDPNRI